MSNQTTNNQLAEKKKDEIPKVIISPGLQIYKKQLHSLMSMGHRLSGLYLFVGMSYLIWWFVSLIFSDHNQRAEIFAYGQNWFFQAGVVIMMVCWCYHLCTGLRHLVWDLGFCLSIKEVKITGIVAIVMAIILFTALFFKVWL